MGIKNMIEEIKDSFPDLTVGYFNQPVRDARPEKRGCFCNAKPIIVHFMITGAINLFVTTKELRQRVADEFKYDVCNECNIEEFSLYLYNKIVKMLKKEEDK